MKKIRIGNDFVLSWAIERGGVPENLENVLDKHLYMIVFGTKTEIHNYTVSGNNIIVEFTPELLNKIGIYTLIFYYVLPDTSLSDDDRKCTVDIDAFQIVPRTAMADDVSEFAVTSDMAIAFKGEKGDNAYQVWLNEGNVGAIDDYFAYLRQPATDAGIAVQEQTNLFISEKNEEIDNVVGEITYNEARRLEAEALRVSAESTRVENENARIEAEALRVEAEGDETKGRVKAELDRVEAEAQRVLAEAGRAAELASKAAHGYGEEPQKTLKQVDEELGQLSENAEQKINKQNSLISDGTGTKYPTVDAVNAGLALKQDANLLATYVHSGNKEIYISSIDYSTNTFISVGHGLTNNTNYINNICVALNKNELIYPIDVLPFIIETSDYLGYYIVNATTDTFQISRTAGGTPITLTDKVTNDLTKWHFERGATQNNVTLSITGLLGKIDDGCKTIVEGTLLWGYTSYIGAKHNLGRVYAKHTDGQNVAYNYATIYGRNDFPIPCFGGNIVHTDIYTPNGHRKIFDINVTSFSSTANRIGVMTKIITYVSPITVTGVKDRVNISFLPANGTIIKVYKL